MVGEMNYEYSGLSGNASEFAGKNIKYLSKKYGTPVIVYNMARIMENIKRLTYAFSGIHIKIHYAVKANYNPYIVSGIIRAGVGIDAANYNEVLLALMAGAGKSEIMATPNNLSVHDLESIRDSGVAINFDHEGQMDQLNGNIPETASFRINPGIGKVGREVTGKGIRAGTWIRAQQNTSDTHR